MGGEIFKRMLSFLLVDKRGLFYKIVHRGIRNSRNFHHGKRNRQRNQVAKFLNKFQVHFVLYNQPPWLDVSDTSVSYFSFFAQAVSIHYLWNMAVIVTNVVWTIGLVLEAFRGDICCSWRILLPNNSAFPHSSSVWPSYTKKEEGLHLKPVTLLQEPCFNFQYRVYLLPRRYSSPSRSTKWSSEFES